MKTAWPALSGHRDSLPAAGELRKEDGRSPGSQASTDNSQGREGPAG